MRLRDVDLNLFLVFEAIYSEGNLSRASERLFITQPAVSNALSRLRERLDDPLFVRTPKGMIPTPVADNMINPVREALKLLNTSVQLSDQFNPQTAENSFQLSMHDANELTLMPKLLAGLERVAPHVSVASYPVSRQDLVRELASGQLDLAIDVPLINHPDVCHQLLTTIPYVCLVRADHPDIGDSLDFDQYLSLGHINVSSRRRGFGLVDDALRKLGEKRNIQCRTSHHLVGPSIVRNTNMALTAPMTIADDAGVKALPLPFDVPPIELHLYWHRSADQDKANLWLRAFVMDQTHL